MASRDVPPLSSIEPLRWEESRLSVIDQRQLPQQLEWLTLRTVEEVAQAIEQLVVRGAPLIGITAAYGVALAALASSRPANLKHAINRLKRTRPTARDLFAALERLELLLDQPQLSAARLLDEARAIHHADLLASSRIALLAEQVLSGAGWALTICNTGALATGGGGTALGLLVQGYRLGLLDGIYVCETRPLLQGARLTCWELARLGIPFTLLPDSAAASLLAGGEVAAVVTGADRIARNGDTANKVGTRMLAESAHYNDVPFFVAAPATTFDPGAESGADITIEQRSRAEVLEMTWQPLLPPDYAVYNPAFDITEGRLIAAFATDRGLISVTSLEDSDLWI
jgi:methylthioribose-1-phosphate isomerase